MDISALLHRLRYFVRTYNCEGVGLELPAAEWKELREDIAKAIDLIEESHLK